MKKRFLFQSSTIAIILVLLIMPPFRNCLQAQEITLYQFRYVPPEKADEFVKRETTYWSRVARKAIKDGKLSFWGLFERIGGMNEGHAPNYLFINTYTSIDSAGDVWDASKLFPKIPMSQIEDGSFTKTTGNIFLSSKGREQAANVVEEKDFNYVAMYYHNSSNADSFTNAEIKVWGPFIKSAMDKKQTAQRGWGNAVVLAPIGSDMKFNSVSFDLFPTLRDALLMNWDPSVQFPSDGLNELDKLRTTAPNREIYRVVMVVNKENTK